MQQNNRTIQQIDTWTNRLLVVIVLIPFALSAAALQDLAHKNGVKFSWLYPIMVDGGLIIFKLLVLRASLRGTSDRYAWFMAVSATVASVALNVVHAPPEILSQIMAGLPPLVILFAFIAVSRRLEETAKEEGLVANLTQLAQQIADKTGEIGRLSADLATKQTEHATAVAELQASYAAEQTRLSADAEALRTQIATLKEAKTAARRELADTQRESVRDKTAVTPDPPADSDAHGELTERQVTILAMLKSDKSRAEIADTIGVSEKTIYRDIKAMNGTATAVLGGA